MMPAEVRTALRRVRRHLPIRVLTKDPNQNRALRSVAEHEAAHAVVALAGGCSVLMIHVGSTMGDVVLSNNKIDGLWCGLVPHDALGRVAVAGVVHDRVPWIGVLDAVLLLQWLFHTVGPYPCQHPEKTQRQIRAARRSARTILRTHAAAIDALATALEKSSTITDPATIRRIARKASPALPEPQNEARRMESVWRRALRGDQKARDTLPGPVGAIADMVRKHLNSAGRPRPNPQKPRATRRM